MNALEVLQSWGYNEGEFEELVNILANNQGFKRLQASYDPDAEKISYEYELSENGEQIAMEWAKKNNCSCIDSRGEIEDLNESSIENTLEMLGNPDEKYGNTISWKQIVIDE